VNKVVVAATAVLALTTFVSGAAPVAAASSLARGSVTLIDTQTNTRGATVPVGKLPSEISLSPDGKTAYLLNTVSSTVSLVSRASGVLTSRTIKAGRYPIGIAMTPSGNRVFIARHQNFGLGSVLPVRAATGIPGQAVSPPRQQGYIAGAVAATPDGREVYAEEDGLLSPWVGLLPIRTTGDRVGTPIKFGRQPYGIEDMDFTPDSKTLYVLSTTGRKVLLTAIRTATGKVGTPIKLWAPAVAMVMTPDGRFIYVSDYYHGIVTVIRTATNSILKRIPVNDAMALAMAPDGKTVYAGGAAAGTGTGEVIPISTASNTAGPPVTVSPDGDITAIAVSPDGSAVYAALGFNDEVVPIDTATQTAQTPIPVGVHPALLAMARDGTLYVVNSPDQG
jgi:YVTN family beta-propeller protein